MNPLGKRITVAVLCMSACAAPLFLGGCGLSNVTKQISQGSQKAQQNDVELFNKYIKAIGDFNSRSLTFSYANTPDMEDLKSGKHLTSFSSPDFKRLEEALQEAKNAGVPYDDMNEPLDKVLAVLHDIVPVADELNAYYDAKTYTTDNYAKEQQLGPKYVQLYEQFYAVYPALDDIIHKHNTERQKEHLKEMKDAGQKNGAAVQEVHLRLTDIIDGLESNKPIDANAVNQELQAISDLANTINKSEYDSTKRSLHQTIGAIRTFMSNQDDKNYENMISQYNDFISDMNNLDIHGLDK